MMPFLHTVTPSSSLLPTGLRTRIVCSGWGVVRPLIGTVPPWLHLRVTVPLDLNPTDGESPVPYPLSSEGVCWIKKHLRFTRCLTNNFPHHGLLITNWELKTLKVLASLKTCRVLRVYTTPTFEWETPEVSTKFSIVHQLFEGPIHRLTFLRRGSIFK